MSPVLVTAMEAASGGKIGIETQLARLSLPMLLRTDGDQAIAHVLASDANGITTAGQPRVQQQAKASRSRVPTGQRASKRSSSSCVHV